jgi:CRP/FNR family transcriptional regulator, cyclic AMP receptor protein
VPCRARVKSKPVFRRASGHLKATTLLSGPEPVVPAPDILGALAAGTRTAVQSIGRRRDYQPGDIVFRQGDAHDGIFLIEEGVVKSYYVSEDGRELTLGFWTAGHYLGAPQMFGGGQHAWTSVAHTSTRCLWLPGPELRTLSAGHADLAVALIDALVHKSQCYCAILQLLATHSMRVRLARLLVMLAAGTEDAVITLSHFELASMIGSTRQWVSSSLSRFEHEALVERIAAGGFRVVDVRRLASLH